MLEMRDEPRSGRKLNQLILFRKSCDYLLDAGDSPRIRRQSSQWPRSNGAHAWAFSITSASRPTRVTVGSDHGKRPIRETTGCCRYRPGVRPTGLPAVPLRAREDASLLSCQRLRPRARLCRPGVPRSHRRSFFLCRIRRRRLRQVGAVAGANVTDSATTAAPSPV